MVRNFSHAGKIQGPPRLANVGGGVFSVPLSHCCAPEGVREHWDEDQTITLSNLEDEYHLDAERNASYMVASTAQGFDWVTANSTIPHSRPRGDSEISESHAAAAARGALLISKDAIGSPVKDLPWRPPEWARLQRVIGEYGRKATMGCPCWFFDEAGRRVPTRYRVDRSFAHLAILAPSDGKSALASCPISSITDVISYVDDRTALFPDEVVESLVPAELELLMMVVYGSGGQEESPKRFCILGETSEGKKHFLDLIKGLCFCIRAAARRGRQAL